MYVVCFTTSSLLVCSVEMIPSGPEEGDNANSPALVILEYLLLVSSALYLTLDR